MGKSIKRKREQTWQEVAKEAQDHRDASLAKVQPGLPAALERIRLSEGLPKNSMSIPGKTLHPGDFRITETLPEQLVKALSTGELSATNVTTAFLRRAVLAQMLVSWLLFLFLVNIRLITNNNVDKLRHRAPSRASVEAS